MDNSNTGFRWSVPSSKNLIILFLFVLITGIISFLMLGKVKHQMEASVHDKLQTVCMASQRVVSAWIEDRLDDVGLITDNDSVKDLIEQLLGANAKGDDVVMHPAQRKIRDHFAQIGRAHV